jgi:hypothetical protein
MKTPPNCCINCYMAWVSWLALYALMAHRIMMAVRWNALVVAYAMRRPSDQLDA